MSTVLCFGCQCVPEFRQTEWDWLHAPPPFPRSTRKPCSSGPTTSLKSVELEMEARKKQHGVYLDRRKRLEIKNHSTILDLVRELINVRRNVNIYVMSSLDFTRQFTRKEETNQNSQNIEIVVLESSWNYCQRMPRGVPEHMVLVRYIH